MEHKFRSGRSPETGPLAAIAADDGTTALTVRLIRPADQLDVTLELADVTLDAATNELVADASPDAQPRMRVHLGAQHTAEDALTDLAANPPGTAALKQRTAGASRLVTTLPTPLPFTVDALLDVAAWSLLNPTGAGAATADETALEVPVGLVLAPAETAEATTTGNPRTEEDVTELWRLGLTADDEGLAMIAVENVAPADARGTDNPVPRASDRDEIVINTTDPLATGHGPAYARRLELSSQGAFAHLEGDWPDAEIERWRQTIIGGRDIVAEIVREGYLLPFGHRVKILEVNSRRMVTDVDDHPVTVLENETFMLIDGSSVDFDSGPGMEYRRYGGRRLPFTKVEIAPSEWIPVDLPELSDSNGVITGVSDVRSLVTDATVPVTYTATDRIGRGGITFTTDATFVDRDEAFDTSDGGSLARYANWLAEPAQHARRTVDLGGQTVAFADELSVGNGKTSFGTNTIELAFSAAIGAPVSTLENALRLGTFPEIDVATIIDDAVAAGLGDDVQELTVALHQRWLEFGIDFDGNFDQAFLKLSERADKDLGDAAQAIAAIGIIGDVFNQTVGIGQDLADLAADWNAADAFSTASKILGFIELHDILGPVDFSQATPGLEIPGLDVTVDEDGFKAVFEYEPAIRSFSELGFFVPDGNRALVRNETCVPFEGEPENTLTIRLNDVTIQFPPTEAFLIELLFSKIEVIESTTDDTILDVDLADWRWGPMLAWLKPLTNLLDQLGGGLVDINPGSIGLSSDFPLPAIKLGVIEVNNLTLFSGVDFPFDGRVPTAELGIGSASAPVEVSVLSYGAEFYVEVEVSPGAPGGLKRLTASLELEAMLYGFDIVVASADITLRISALFEIKNGDIKFVGAVGIEGNVSVLGFLDASIGLVASVTYKSATENVVLRGDVTYSVNTFLGGASGRIPIGQMTFELGDGNGASAVGPGLAALTGTAGAPSEAEESPTSPPSFRDKYTSDEWRDDYVAAFA